MKRKIGSLAVNKARRKQGFTLMELLCVVGIIVVLTAMVIPVFDGSAEKAREAKDLNNIRVAASKVQNSYALGEKIDGVSYSNDGKNYYVNVYVEQVKPNWQTNGDNASINVSGLSIPACTKTSAKGWKLYCYDSGTKEGILKVKIREFS